MDASEAISSVTELPVVVDVPGQPCQRLYGECLPQEIDWMLRGEANLGFSQPLFPITDRNPVLLGFDVVQYHFITSFADGGVAVRGESDYAFNFEGYQFWFSSEANRNLFISDPWKYAPAFGGFCSWGMAKEFPRRWPWQPDFLGPPASPWNGWLVIDGVLMFNIWASFSDKFVRNEEENVRVAKERWISFFGDLHSGPFNTHCIGHGKLKNYCISQQPSPWLKSLPECEIEIVGRNTTTRNDTEYDFAQDCLKDALDGGKSVSQECLEVIKVKNSGGIVSLKNAYEDFSNGRLTPHMTKMFKICVPIAACILFFGLYWAKLREIKQEKQREANEAEISNVANVKDPAKDEKDVESEDTGASLDQIPPQPEDAQLA